MNPLRHCTMMYGSTHDADSNACSCLHLKGIPDCQKQSSSCNPEEPQSGLYLILGQEGAMKRKSRRVAPNSAH